MQEVSGSIPLTSTTVVENNRRSSQEFRVQGFDPIV
jgi:hypothetical protein